MEPIVCEVCYKFLNNVKDYLIHQQINHKESEE